MGAPNRLLTYAFTPRKKIVRAMEEEVAAFRLSPNCSTVRGWAIKGPYYEGPMPYGVHARCTVKRYNDNGEWVTWRAHLRIEVERRGSALTLTFPQNRER